MKIESKTVHWADRRKPEADFVPCTTPIYTATSYIYDSMEDLDKVFGLEKQGPSYSRFDNPTRVVLEELLRELEGGAGAFASASGMSALYLALAAILLDRPKRVLAASALYGTTTNMLLNIFGPLGIEPTFVDVCDLAAVEKALADTKPGAMLIETISNPLLRVAAIDRIAELTRKSDVPLIVDSTFATPMLLRPLELGANVVVHSATKYLAGHGDVLGGAIIADKENFEPIRRLARTLGPVMGPFESYLTLRGIKTLALRVERQCSNACKVAQWLASQPGVDRVYFTGDPAHPDAATIARLFEKNRTGALVAFELKGAVRAHVMAFMDRLKMVVRGASLGDVHTMMLYPVMASHRDISPKQRERMGIRDNLVRMSIGIEAAEDILADLAQALG